MHISLKAGANEVAGVKKVKDLGVIVDDTLRFTSHISIIMCSRQALVIV